MHRTARLTTALFGLTAGALLVSGCGPATETTPEGGGDVTIRFAWWGSDARHTATEAAVDAFEEANPGITVETEFGDWGGYWDRLATQTAGGNTPDVVQMSDAYLAEYAGRGVLLPLADRPEIDMTALDDAGVDSGEVDGEVYALQAGANFPAVLANPALFAAAGIEMPDDASWDWSDYEEISAAFAKAGTGAAGTDSIIGDPITNAWLLQRGDALFTADGEVGFDPDGLTGYFELVSGLSSSGGAPEASVITEQMVLSPDQWGIATGKSAMGFAWSNLLTTIEGSLGSELELLRLPSDGEESGIYLRGAMYYSIAASSKHPAESAKLIDFLLNDEAAADELLAERGLPLNTDIREYIADKVSEPEQRLIAFTVDYSDAFGKAPAVPAVGGGTYDQVVQRGISDVLFGTISPQEASQRVHKELSDLLIAAG
ncbi:ABC transporter substrate-binding protein [Microbacterium hydrocarbonoxydans]|uniref:ABC transporter substrate-binding protein n=1 Tax=Microbacterium hydrocarbonoxydans TaxID=273678 RepID=UPI0013DD3822|nr:extracellular solute-binding protein [Microbacterium hydrocarbonoxydans]